MNPRGGSFKGRAVRLTMGMPLAALARVYAPRSAEVWTSEGALRDGTDLPCPHNAETILITACADERFRLGGQVLSRGGACPFGGFRYAVVAHLPCYHPVNPTTRAFDAQRAFDPLSVLPFGLAFGIWLLTFLKAL